VEQRWYLDSGASNHMTGSKTAFYELGSGMKGSVKFGDNSKVVVSHDIMFDEKAAWD